MPTYDYQCPNCHNPFSIVQSIQDYNGKAQCPCGQRCDSSSRLFFNQTVFIGTKVSTAEYNPGLGRVIKNRRQLDDVCKERNLVEIGNDFSSGEKMQTDFEQKKKAELEKSWGNL